MLTISKKAVTENDARKLLQDSYQIRKPFGVHTLIIDPADYRQESSFWRILSSNSPKKRLQKEIFEAFQQSGTPSTKDEIFFNHSKNITETAFKWINEINEGNISSSNLIARSFLLEDRGRNLNIILFQESADPGKKFISSTLNIPMAKLPDYPGSDAQWNFAHLWHEIGHGLSGANEAGADKVSASVCRNAFQDCNFLAVYADLRAAASLLSDNAFPNYGWSCVEAIDSVIAQDGPISWDEIWDTGAFARTAPRDDRIASAQYAAAWNLYHAASMAFYPHTNLAQMAATGDRLLQENAFQNPDQRNITARFTLAARRLSIGIQAYGQAAPALL